MRIVNHIGANCTDDNRLLESLIKNRVRFKELGVAVPPPTAYRKLLRETIQELGGHPPEPGAGEVLLDEILDGQAAETVILSNSRFICVPRRIFEHRVFYRLLDEKLCGMRALFPDHERHICLAMRNLASFIPAAFSEIDGLTLEQFLKGLDPKTLRWSSVVERIRTLDPEARVTVWCDEDTPLIWARLIRSVAHVSQQTPITGGYDMLTHILSTEGFQRFTAFMRTNPPETEEQKRKIVTAFLEKFALPERIEEEIDLPGWTPDLIAALCANYDDDVARIRTMDGVNLLTP